MNKPNSWPKNRPDAEEWRERFAEADAAAGFEVTEDFEQFNQRNDMFSRAFWDDTVRSKHTEAFFDSYRVEADPRLGDGFTQKDLALRLAAWSISDLIRDRSAGDGKQEGFYALIRDDSEVAKTQIEIDDPEAITREIKKIARLFGADIVGVTDYDERWNYKSRVDTRDFTDAEHDLPEGIRSVIVMGHAMDKELVKTYPSALAGSATGLEYSNEAAASIKLATYLRGLGFESCASMNDTSLVIPYAIKAGLGEYGRNQMVITPEFGPRVRFSKVFTTLPLAYDKPKKFGVREFCDICQICAESCPPKALPFGPPTDTPKNQSTIKGVKKWSADCEKCFGYWAKLRSDCAICMRVCPYNRDYGEWQSRFFRWLASGPTRHIALWWARRSERGKRLKPSAWWSSLRD